MFTLIFLVFKVYSYLYVFALSDELQLKESGIFAFFQASLGYMRLVFSSPYRTKTLECCNLLSVVSSPLPILPIYCSILLALCVDSG